MFIGFIVKQKTAAYTSPIDVCAAVLKAFSYTLCPMFRYPMQPASKKVSYNRRKSFRFCFCKYSAIS